MVVSYVIVRHYAVFQHNLYIYAISTSKPPVLCSGVGQPGVPEGLITLRSVVQIHSPLVSVKSSRPPPINALVAYAPYGLGSLA